MITSCATGTCCLTFAPGARFINQGCNGCIGIGQAPATGKISLRTVPRNFPGRSGTREGKVCLESPKTAAASALTGMITDPRTLGIPYPKVSEPVKPILNTEILLPPFPSRKLVAFNLSRVPTSPRCPRSSRCPRHWTFRFYSRRRMIFRPTKLRRPALAILASPVIHELS